MYSHSRNHCHPAYKGLRILGLAIIGLFTAVIFGLLFGYFVEIIWNWLVPPLFKLSKITYLQACALVILARFIFGSFGHSHGNDYHYHDRPNRWYRHHPRYYRFEKRNLQEWECYDFWWREEGKAAFENYVAKMEHKDQES